MAVSREMWILQNALDWFGMDEGKAMEIFRPFGEIKGQVPSLGSLYYLGFTRGADFFFFKSGTHCSSGCP